MVWMRTYCSRGPAWRSEIAAHLDKEYEFETSAIERGVSSVVLAQCLTICRNSLYQLLLPLLFTTVVMSSAFAFTATPQPHLDSVDLICLPPLDRHDANPVIRIHVTAQFDEDMNVTQLDVVHWLFDGAQHNRSDQYTNDFLGRKTGHLDWNWRGTWVKNSSVKMIGHLYFNNQGWFYEEIQFANDRLSFDIISPCEEYRQREKL